MFNATTMWRIGCVSGASSVALGAFGAHGFRHRTSDATRIATWQTAAHYHLAHSLALALAASARPTTAAPALFASGIVLFSGSLYAHAWSPSKWLPHVAPLGGLALIAGWLAMAL
eukprot:TRINITY_DN3869_c0_g1_i1.p1 TRINITY_DN3869_c0_g1~~TRINITY_DN3869_c0_g1_i1.p1  ORF type:complete len:115 (+),score=11.47 TRINITY_DN3869_c0_g1_i1:71-415(+)